jgi:hypothetical protein
MLKKFTLACIAVIAIHANAQEVLRLQNGASLTLQPGAEVHVLGTTTLINGSTLTNNGTIHVRRNGAAGTADWLDGTITGYYHGTGKWIFNSTAISSINSNNLFQQIDMQGAGLSFASNINVNKWFLVSGIVTTNAFRAITWSNLQLAVEPAPGNPGFSLSWFNGNLRRYINPAVVNNYIFPVGDATKPNPAELDDLSSTPLTGVSYIDAAFGAKPGSDAGLAVSENGTSYVSVNSGGVWYLISDATPASGQYDLKLFFTAFTGLQNNRFAILLRPAASSNAADWAVPPASTLNANGGAGRMAADGYARRNNIANFGQLGIGELSAALPVTLLGFDAVRLNNLKVQLHWETQTEQNNKGFEIERRLDNEPVFSPTGFVLSKTVDGNSAIPLKYDLVDANGYGGISYYRLKQLDRDGRSFYSLIKAVRGTGQTSVSVLLWPNPAKGQFSIRMDGANGTKDAFITEVSGKPIRTLRIANRQQVNIHGLAAGTYILKVKDAFGEGEHFTEKVLVVK